MVGSDDAEKHLLQGQCKFDQHLLMLGTNYRAHRYQGEIGQEIGDIVTILVLMVGVLVGIRGQWEVGTLAKLNLVVCVCEAVRLRGLQRGLGAGQLCWGAARNVTEGHGKNGNLSFGLWNGGRKLPMVGADHRKVFFKLLSAHFLVSVCVMTLCIIVYHVSKSRLGPFYGTKGHFLPF